MARAELWLELNYAPSLFTCMSRTQLPLQENVLAHRAEATVNFRLHPADSPAAVLKHVREVIAEPRVQIKVTGERPATQPSPTRGAFGYELLEATVQQVFPHAVISPCEFVRRVLDLWPC